MYILQKNQIFILIVYKYLAKHIKVLYNLSWLR